MFSLVPRRRARTALARWGFEPFEFFRREFGPLFELPTFDWEPELWGFETEERENEFVLRAEMPGFEPGEFEVTLRGNELTARAEHTAAEGETRESRRLERTMTLPPGFEPEKVEARYRHGVLEVHVPRAPGAMPRRIEVKT